LTLYLQPAIGHGGLSENKMSAWSKYGFDYTK